MDVKAGSPWQRHFGLEWTLSAVVTLIALVAWGTTRHIGQQPLGIYDVFPLFGLIAFSWMWVAYVSGAARRLLKLGKPHGHLYWSVSSGLILAAIIIHPLLVSSGLAWDGLGLPPGSYFAAYQSLGWFLLLGSAALLIFLSYELRRWWGKASWWKWVESAQKLAMVAIFIHSLVLGRELTVGWFKTIWWLYGLTLMAAWVYNYYYDKRRVGR